MAPKGRSGNGRPKQSLSSPSPEIAISKALSYVLRHAAVKEGIKIDARGYVAVEDLLNWRKLRSLNCNMFNLVTIVRDNSKQRFSLLYTPPIDSTTINPTNPTSSLNPEIPPQPGSLGTSATLLDDPIAPDPSNLTIADDTRPTLLPNEYALTVYFSQDESIRDTNPAHYLIRATQGHSLPTEALDPSSYLKPITLDNEASIPDTVVHGTFWGAWGRIAQSGGLKRMGRVFVHFATKPSADEVLRRIGDDSLTSIESTATFENLSPSDLLSSATDSVPIPSDDSSSTSAADPIRSGMRSDANVLIFIDIRVALSAGYKFWISENGVVLCDGVLTATTDTPDESTLKQADGLIPLRYFSLAVEKEEGVGVLCRNGEIVKELPRRLLGTGRGKMGAGGGGKKERGGKGRR